MEVIIQIFNYYKIWYDILILISIIINTMPLRGVCQLYIYYVNIDGNQRTDYSTVQ